MIKKVLLPLIFIAGLFIEINNCYADENTINIYKAEKPTDIKKEVTNNNIKVYFKNKNGEETNKTGSISSYKNYYIEGDKVDSSYYTYYNIKNNVGINEKLYIDINFDKTYSIINNEIENESETYKDLRLIFDYGTGRGKSDVNISGYNSVSYYLIDELNNSYGPFSLYTSIYEDATKGINGSNEVYIDRYKVISNNLLNDSNLNGKNIKAA